MAYLFLMFKYCFQNEKGTRNNARPNLSLEKLKLVAYYTKIYRTIRITRVRVRVLICGPCDRCAPVAPANTINM